jgi:rhodanese-related sulfurtransferase
MINVMIYGALLIMIAWMVYRMVAPIKGLKTLDTKQFAQAYQGNPLIDVRESYEYHSGHIVKAVNIPLSQLKSRLSEIPKDKPIYLYCKSGMRSRQAASILAQQGYTDLTHLAGGIMSWNGPKTKPQ